MLDQDRFNYPVNHIEADNRLAWLLGRLDKAYGDDAFYVHLRRSEADTALSFTKRYSFGIIRAYRRDGIIMGLPEQTDPMAVARDYCQTVNSNIELFLKDKTRKIEINLEDIDRDFAVFWKIIGAEGRLDAALAEFNTHYNSSKAPQESHNDELTSRILRKLKRLIVKLPDYIKAA
jgi:hypothetical protein